MKALDFFNSTWVYEHRFGLISVSGWGDPHLVLTDDKYMDGQHWAYNFWRLGVSFPDENTGMVEVDRLNKEYNLPELFTPEGSQNLLLKIQELYPLANIKKTAL